ncbi:nitroreductase family protein [Paenibacillus bouchesdurhonensis]|uniref:nitroreductase family protein n=1 Tax=Paenibacillus bouchesdurhonensis TaxID=1870990 RepID=UPI000DA6198B|nr:nitroreductase family protein [Paenibacillus bouchesdurhonensis]
MEFIELIDKRRSANNFIEGVQITEKDLEPIFKDIMLAPSSFNLQPSEYIVVMDKEMKEKIREAAYNQYKVHSASAVIIVTADRQAFEQTERLHQGMLALGILKEFEVQEIIEDNWKFYESRGEDFKKEDAVRNGSLSAMLFMLAAKNRGWDTCPMIGFDQEKVRELLNIPHTHEVVLMITIGKEKEESRRLRGYRKPVGEFVSYF